MSEYHKIETLYERDEQTHRLKQPLVLKNRVYGLVNPWVFTEKIDGTNIRAIWHAGRLTFRGKTDNAQMHAGLVERRRGRPCTEKAKYEAADAMHSP